jgi:hypothetical protein
MIYSKSPYVFVDSNSAVPYVNMSNPSAGMVRCNGTQLEVYDGYSWLTYTQTSTISTSAELDNVVSWAKEKMLEEAKIKELCKKFPALQKAKDNYDMIKAFVENEDIETRV